MALEGRRRRGRRPAGAQTSSSDVAPTYVERAIARVEFLSEDGLEKLEDQAEWLIQEIGPECHEDPAALEPWRAAGTDVKDIRVKAARGMTCALCETAPQEFTQLARDPARSVRIGGTSQVFAPVNGAPFARDLEAGRRYGTIEDFEARVIDADRLGGYQKLLGGAPFDDNALARQAYQEVEPAGYFLGCSHTMENDKTAFYESALSDSENVESWEERGAKEMQQRAFERWAGLLADYEAPPIDPAVDERLRDFVARRKTELPDAWY